jgi:hypothetical protein
MGAADIVDILAATLGDVQAVRAAALAAGSSALVLRTADSTIRAASALADRLGLDPAEIAREMRDAEDLGRVIGATIHQHPEVADWMADQAAKVLDDDDDEHALRRLAEKARARLEIEKQ